MKVDTRAVAAFVGATLLVALMAAASFQAFKQTEEAAARRKQTFIIIDRANALLSALTDAETGERGYALTGDEAFLEPYLAVRENVAGQLQTVRQLASTTASSTYLDAMVPLVDAKLAAMSHNIGLRRSNDVTAVVAAVSSGRGRQLMDAIRAQMHSFMEIENEALAQRDATFAANMRTLFAIIATSGVFTLVLALAFVFLVYRETQHRLKGLVHLQTQHLLDAQTETNKQLQQANLSLLESEEKLAVTLYSIGDAVIATDREGRVTRLNPFAERLTGWTQQEATGRPVGDVFHIVNKVTRAPGKIPVLETLALGTTQGLANHTVLIARSGGEHDIADSCAPIRDRDGHVIGAILVFRDVTAEYATQQALRDSAALIQTVLDTVADSIITLHAEGSVIARTNAAAERMFGYAAEELIGKQFGVLIPELDRGQGNGLLEVYNASSAARAVGLRREIEGRRKDGSSFPLEMAVAEMWLDGERYFTTILRDTSAQKQAEEALRKTGALQNAIFNSANFSSIATDAKGVIQIFNVGAERMLGYTAADVMNSITPADISDPEEVIVRAQTLSIELSTPITPGFEALVFKASRGIEDIYELTYIRKDGSRFPAVVSVTALRDANETIIGYLLIGTDNTARRRVEAERTLLDQALHEKNAELERAKSAAERANLAKSDFLSSMSHELRTPLSAILGFAQLIDSGSPPPTAGQKRSIDQILQAGWYLLELINEILDLALIESGKVSLSLETVALAEVMRECRTMIEPQARKRDISISFSPFDNPFYVNVDRTRLKQVLINLLSNAIKYNRVGGSVVVACVVGPLGRLRIKVTDTGEGLAVDELEQLFQPFNRLGQKANVIEGTGIGLVVAKRLIESMGGAIGVESVVGKGSVFWIELDVAAAPAAIASAAITADVRAQTRSAAQVRTVLYVEDNPANLMLVEDLIARRPDIHLLTARDGNLGVDVARAALPDVILMDINLPGISGVDALRILMNDPATAHIPIIALSANAVPRDIAKGLEAGFFRYLTKPIKVNEFMDTLDVALKLAKAHSARAGGESTA